MQIFAWFHWDMRNFLGIFRVSLATPDGRDGVRRERQQQEEAQEEGRRIHNEVPTCGRVLHVLLLNVYHARTQENKLLGVRLLPGVSAFNRRAYAGELCIGEFDRRGVGVFSYERTGKRFAQFSAGTRR